MALIAWTFDGVATAPYGYSMQIGTPGNIPTSVRWTLAGTCVIAYAAYSEEYNLGAAGVVSKSLFDSLRAKLGTEGSLVTSQGTCTATLVKCEGTPRSGDPGGSGHLVAAVFGWMKKGDWS